MDCNRSNLAARSFDIPVFGKTSSHSFQHLLNYAALAMVFERPARKESLYPVTIHSSHHYFAFHKDFTRVDSLMQMFMVLPLFVV